MVDTCCPLFFASSSPAKVQKAGKSLARSTLLAIYHQPRDHLTFDKSMFEVDPYIDSDLAVNIK
jgi:hypothetical protein